LQELVGVVTRELILELTASSSASLELILVT